MTGFGDNQKSGVRRWVKPSKEELKKTKKNKKFLKVCGKVQEGLVFLNSSLYLTFKKLKQPL
jgi:hypothetical protein